jgi:hypothetical protein
MTILGEEILLIVGYVHAKQAMKHTPTTFWIVPVLSPKAVKTRQNYSTYLWY